MTSRLGNFYAIFLLHLLHREILLLLELPDARYVKRMFRCNRSDAASCVYRFTILIFLQRPDVRQEGRDPLK